MTGMRGAYGQSSSWSFIPLISGKFARRRDEPEAIIQWGECRNSSAEAEHAR